MAKELKLLFYRFLGCDTRRTVYRISYFKESTSCHLYLFIDAETLCLINGGELIRHEPSLIVLTRNAIEIFQLLLHRVERSNDIVLLGRTELVEGPLPSEN